MERKNIYIKIVVNLLITIFFALLAIFLLPRILSFFFPFVVAFVLSLLVNPIVRGMEHKIKIKRKHGSAIIIILVLAAIVGLLYVLGSILVRELIRLISDLPDIAAKVSEFLSQLSVRFSSFYEILPKSVQGFFNNFNEYLSQFFSNFFDGVDLSRVSKAGSYVRGVGNVVFMSIVTILATYFLVAERDNMARTMNKVLPKSIQSGYRVVTCNFKNAVGGYFKAQFKIMLILLVVMCITFFILKIDYAFLLALLIAFIDLLPVFGTGLVFWPWAIIDFINQNFVRAIVILALYLVCQIIKQILQPKMVGDSIGVSPFLTLVFMFVGYKISGFLGLILGVPIGMVFMSFYRMGMFDRIIRGIKIIVTDINEYRKY